MEDAVLYATSAAGLMYLASEIAQYYGAKKVFSESDKIKAMRAASRYVSAYKEGNILMKICGIGIKLAAKDFLKKSE